MADEFKIKVEDNSWEHDMHTTRDPKCSSCYSEQSEEIRLLNMCNSETLIERIPTKYGYQSSYQVGGKKVILSYNQYSNGGDDYDDELVDVEVINELKTKKN